MKLLCTMRLKKPYRISEGGITTLQDTATCIYDSGDTPVQLDEPWNVLLSSFNLADEEQFAKASDVDTFTTQVIDTDQALSLVKGDKS